MTYLIALDDGHGMETAGKRTPYIKSLGRQIKENEFNRAVIKFLDENLKRCGFRTLLVAPTDADTPLTTRVALANKAKADFYLSIHYDALDAKFDGPGKDPEGFTVFVYLNNVNKSSGQFAKLAVKHLSAGTKQQNRGVKEANFQVLRETNMPAALVECGFMDNEREALLMINESFQREVALELAKALCEHFGIKFIDAENTVKKGDEDMDFYSPTMREKFEMRTASPATKKLLIEKAVVELGYQKSWIVNHEKGLLKDGDYAAIAYELAIHLLKK
ncbi:hypothetical protein MTP04_02930 [Lysinibacillus sp. PLM2]|nr:hypothetical protein MTP04_02930 [Lysinibacillus sp. PLM2]